MNRSPSILVSVVYSKHISQSLNALCAGRRSHLVMCFGLPFKASGLECYKISKSRYRVGMMAKKPPIFCHEETTKLSMVMLTGHKSSLPCPGCWKPATFYSGRGYLGFGSDDPLHSSSLVQLEFRRILCRSDICRMQWLNITKMQWQICSVLLGLSPGSATDLLDYVNADYIPGYIHSSEHSQEACKRSQATQDTQSNRVVLVQFSV